MPVRPILITGEPVLHSPAREVTAFDAELRELVEDMVETMAAAPGVGLAGPQVGADLRVFVYDWTDEEGVRFTGTAVNPELWQAPLPLGELDDEEEAEGCLSVPGERFALRRSPRVILRAVDEKGSPFEVTAGGWLARIFQHEYDHLDGVLYADRLDHPEAKALTKAVKKAGWGKPGHSWMPGEDDLEG